MSFLETGRPNRGAYPSALFAALLVAIAYAFLRSDMPVDDMARYVQELGANRFFWDIGHLWTQPSALLLHRLLSPWLSVVQVLELFNILCCAAAGGMFFYTLRTLGVSLVRTGAALVLVFMSFNLLTLGPTGHIKLLVFPFLAFTLHWAVMWEVSTLDGRLFMMERAAWRAGLALGLGACCLVSVLPIAPFLFAVMLWRIVRAQAPYKSIVLFVLATLTGGLLGLLGAWGVALLSQTTDRGLLGFVFQGLADKHAIHPGFFGVFEIPFRVVYSIIYNFVFLPDLGSVGRAALWGQLSDFSPYIWRLMRDVVIAGLTALVLSLGVWKGFVAVRQARGLLTVFAFLLGSLLFSVYENVNDPEHWFQLTLPLVLLLAMYLSRPWAILCFVIWLPYLLVVNLSLYGIPKATFAYQTRQAEFSQAIGPQGLYVGFAEYPGEPDVSLFKFDGLERFRIDLAATQNRDVALTLQDLHKKIESALARRGRVLVFRALDAEDWRGPVLSMTALGMSKKVLFDAFSRYAQKPVQVAGFPAVEIIGLK